MLPHRKGMLVGELGLKEADEQRAIIETSNMKLSCLGINLRRTKRSE